MTKYRVHSFYNDLCTQWTCKQLFNLREELRTRKVSIQNVNTFLIARSKPRAQSLLQLLPLASIEAQLKPQIDANDKLVPSSLFVEQLQCPRKSRQASNSQVTTLLAASKDIFCLWNRLASTVGCTSQVYYINVNALFDCLGVNEGCPQIESNQLEPFTAYIIHLTDILYTLLCNDTRFKVAALSLNGSTSHTSFRQKFSSSPVPGHQLCMSSQLTDLSQQVAIVGDTHPSFRFSKEALRYREVFNNNLVAHVNKFATICSPLFGATSAGTLLDLKTLGFDAFLAQLSSSGFFAGEIGYAQGAAIAYGSEGEDESSDEYS